MVDYSNHNCKGCNETCTTMCDRNQRNDYFSYLIELNEEIRKETEQYLKSIEIEMLNKSYIEKINSEKWLDYYEILKRIERRNKSPPILDD